MFHNEKCAEDATITSSGKKDSRRWDFLGIGSASDATRASVSSHPPTTPKEALPTATKHSARYIE